MVMVTTEDEVTAAGARQPVEAAGRAGIAALAGCQTELAAVMDQAAGLGL
jgi:hypothetical protein